MRRKPEYTHTHKKKKGKGLKKRETLCGSSWWVELSLLDNWNNSHLCPAALLANLLIKLLVFG